MDNNIWEKPEMQEIGHSSDLIKSIDVDGSGDSGFPGNLASPN